MVVNKGKYFYGHARNVCMGIATVALGSATELPIFSAPFKCKIKKCAIIPESAITGAATNNFGVRFKNKGQAGTGTAVIATKTFSNGINATAFNDTDLGAVSNNELQQNDTVTFEKFEAGNGLEMPALTAVIEYVKRG